MTWYRDAKKNIIEGAPKGKMKAEAMLEFEPSPHWGIPPSEAAKKEEDAASEDDDREPSFRGGSASPGMARSSAEEADPLSLISPAAPEIYEETLAGLDGVKFSGDDVAELWRRFKPGSNNMKGFDSLYVGPSGKFFLLLPHTHDETSRAVLTRVHPDLPFAKNRRLKGGGYTHHDLSQMSKIQRVQATKDGVGVTIEMSNPPTMTQLQAIKSAYQMIPGDDKQFIVEVTLHGELKGHLQSFNELVRFVNQYDPDIPIAEAIKRARGSGISQFR